MANPSSLTGQYLVRLQQVPMPLHRRKWEKGRSIRVNDAADADDFTKRAAAVFRSHIDDIMKMIPEDMRPDIAGGPKFADRSRGAPPPGPAPASMRRLAVAGSMPLATVTPLFLPGPNGCR